MGRLYPDSPIESKEAGFLREAALYLDFYGKLLTDRQLEILDYYYNEDYSLSEIAQALGISRQAAHDALRNGTLALTEYEKKLGIVSVYLNGLRDVDIARSALSELRAGFSRLGEASNEAAPGLERLIDDLYVVVTRIENSLTSDNDPGK